MPLKRKDPKIGKKFKESNQEQLVLLRKVYSYQILLRLLAHGRFTGATPVGDPDLWKSKPPKGYSGGQAINNWRIGINAPPDKEINNPDNNPIGSISLEIAKINRDSKTIWITNPLPYMERIMNEGHSSQVPLNSIPITIKEARDYIRSHFKGKIPANVP